MHFTFGFAVSIEILLIEGTDILVSSRTFACCFMNAVHFVEAPPSHPSGGGGQAIADSQNRLGAYWGQVEVTYCRLG
jgi:hypothetical protein